MTNLQTLSQEQLIALIQNMKKSAERKITMKVSDKGALSVYGLGRFPVTLYRGQWERLLGEAEAIKAFIAANGDKLTTKG